MKEFQKGILDNDRVITAENVQRMGEVIALCAVKTVIVRGGILAPFARQQKAKRLFLKVYVKNNGKPR